MKSTVRVVHRTSWFGLSILTVLIAATAVQGQTLPITSATFSFKMTKGSGVEVCKAYLQRLSYTHYTQPPYCDMPEQTDIEGFSELIRVPLHPGEIKRLWPRVAWFNLKQQQSFPDTAAWPVTLVDEFLGRNLFVWQYQTPISMDNNGTTANVIIWRGAGAAFDSLGVACGELKHDAANSNYPQFSKRLGYVLTPDNAAIDELNTKLLFGDPHRKAQKEPGWDSYQPRGDWQSIFKYRGLYYLSTFLRLEPHRTGSGVGEHLGAVGTLAVYLRSEGRLNEVCEYQMTQSAYY